jgi:hypothetical protein
MACPQFADGGGSLHIRRIALKILNQQSQAVLK